MAIRQFTASPIFSLAQRQFFAPFLDRFYLLTVDDVSGAIHFGALSTGDDGTTASPGVTFVSPAVFQNGETAATMIAQMVAANVQCQMVQPKGTHGAFTDGVMAVERADTNAVMATFALPAVDVFAGV